MDLETTQERIYSALDAMAKTLGDSTEVVEFRYLERLVKDRDELLALAHFNIGIPVLSLAERTGIAWPQMYDIVDRVREEQRAESRRHAAEANPFAMFTMPSSAPEPEQPATGGDADAELEALSEPERGDGDD